MDEGDIKVKRLIVHILDNELGVPVLSDMEHPYDVLIMEFIEKHIEKVLKDDSLKRAHFNRNDGKLRTICEGIGSDGDFFITGTREAAKILYDIMQKHPDIPSADLACCVFENQGIGYLGFLKFNYRTSYIHLTGGASSGNLNSIVRQKAALPGDGQKVDECVLVSLRDYGIELIEKKYDIDGQKINYLSQMFLECSGDISNRDKMKMLKKATDSFSKKYCSEDFTMSADIKGAVAECLDKNEEIDIKSIAKDVFKKNPGMEEMYVEHMEKSGLKDRVIEPDQEYAEKVFKKHKIKTDTGIEINLPIDYYKDKDKLEFISNNDGTISIVIKNVSRITDL